MTTTAKHGLNNNGIVKSQETADGGDIHVVDQPKGYEFMVCDNEGRTRHFSDTGYVSQWAAMQAGMRWYFDHEQK